MLSFCVQSKNKNTASTHVSTTEGLNKAETPLSKLDILKQSSDVQNIRFSVPPLIQPGKRT